MKIVIYGTIGEGKTTTAWEIAGLLEEAGITVYVKDENTRFENSDMSKKCLEAMAFKGTVVEIETVSVRKDRL